MSDLKGVEITEDDFWVCKICEYENKRDDTHCGACEEEVENSKEIEVTNNDIDAKDVELISGNQERFENAQELMGSSEIGEMIERNKQIWVCNCKNYNLICCLTCLKCSKERNGLGVLDKKIENHNLQKEDDTVLRKVDDDEVYSNVDREDNFEDNLQSKQIGKESDFDNYRTSSVNYNEERNGDCVNNNNLWKCMSCNIDNWISNNVCVACGVNKDDKVDVPESHGMWRCTKCGIDNLLSNRTCVGCDAIDPNIDKWVCEQCSFLNEKCAVECSACGMKNNNFVKCTMCSKASVFVWDGTVCEDCLRKVQNSEKCENCKQIVSNDGLCKCTMSEYNNVNETEVLCKLCRKYPINSNSTVNDNLLCNKCLKEMGFCRNCGTEVKIDTVMCLKCSVATWICDKCEYINSYSCVTCKSCKNSRLSDMANYLAPGLI